MENVSEACLGADLYPNGCLSSNTTLTSQEKTENVSTVFIKGEEKIVIVKYTKLSFNEI